MIIRILPVFVALVAGSSAVADASRGLIAIDASGDAVVRAAADADPSVLRAWPVDIETDVLTGVRPGERFALPLGDDRVVAVVDRVLPEASGAIVIRGRLDGEPFSQATFVVRSGAVTGVVRAPGRGSWRVRPAGDGHVLLRVDADRLPECAGAPATTPAQALDPPARAETLCESGARIDLFVFYTSVALADAGSTAVIEGEILLGVDAANLAYEQSEIDMRIRLVGMELIDYDESGGYQDHLQRLTDGDDGYMDEAHVIRDEQAVDLVDLIVADGENCGIAWLMPENSTSSEDRGFSVTTWYCAANFVLAHELGHNMGCCAPGDGGGCNGGGLYDYSVGYRYYGDSGTRWRTVMAYSPGSRISYFSNPAVSFDGRPTGVPAEHPDPSDNARTINETAQAIANYRVPACTGNAFADCAVDFADILKILANWGSGGGPSDLNEDGIVDFADILVVLSNWGPCAFE